MANRNHRKLIEEFHKKFDNKTGYYPINMRDLYELNTISKESGKPSEYVINMCFNSMEAGFMAGYKYAKAEMKRR